MKVLVAEDTPTQAALVKMALKSKGHDVVLAKDGIDAVQKAYQEQPDLIVSDVVMPRLNGYQVCRLLKDDPIMASIPVILLTSLDSKQDMFWGLKSGADRYITKGKNAQELVEEMVVFLDEWYKTKKARDVGERSIESRKGDVDFDVMEQVIHLLDDNLFESTVINEIQNLVNTIDDYQKTVTSVLEIMGKVIDFHVGCLYLGDDENPETYFYVNRKVDQEFIPDFWEKVLNFAEQGLTETPLAEVEMKVIDPLKILSKKGNHPAIAQSISITNLYTKGKQSGLIALSSAEESAFTDQTKNTMEIIARQANIVVEHARLYERNKQLSITDGLTKLYNHRYFQDALKREYIRSVRHKNPMTLILLDIDHFKKFNDTYGHQQGDIVLRELARVLQNNVRSLDIAARYGGEEFAIIMPDAGADVGAKVAERLRTGVEKNPFSGQEEVLSVTISLGIITIPHSDVSNTADLIHCADQALYRAKEKGRNRVEIY